MNRRLSDSDWAILLEQERDARALAESDPATLTSDADLDAMLAELDRDIPPARLKLADLLTDPEPTDPEAEPW